MPTQSSSARALANHKVIVGFDVLLNPQVIIEVLSRSTESFDRTDKFTHYQSIASLKEYVLISQDAPASNISRARTMEHGNR